MSVLYYIFFTKSMLIFVYLWLQAVWDDASFLQLQGNPLLNDLWHSASGQIALKLNVKIYDSCTTIEETINAGCFKDSLSRLYFDIMFIESNEFMILLALVEFFLHHYALKASYFCHNK